MIYLRKHHDENLSGVCYLYLGAFLVGKCRLGNIRKDSPSWELMRAKLWNATIYNFGTSPTYYRNLARTADYFQRVWWHKVELVNRDRRSKIDLKCHHLRGRFPHGDMVGYGLGQQKLFNTTINKYQQMILRAGSTHGLRLLTFAEGASIQEGIAAYLNADVEFR